MHLDETIMQTKTVREIVGVLKEIVVDMNPLLHGTQKVYTIIQEHEQAIARQNINRTKFNNYE